MVSQPERRDVRQAGQTTLRVAASPRARHAPLPGEEITTCTLATVPPPSPSAGRPSDAIPCSRRDVQTASRRPGLARLELSLLPTRNVQQAALRQRGVD
eukprot:3618735-Prymnesium_polylepis.2